VTQGTAALWNFGVVTQNIAYLLTGLRMTILLTVVSLLLGVLIGLLIAVARMSRFTILRVLGGFYVDVWRSTPFLAQILWVFFAFPILTGISMTAFTAGVVTLSCHASAYLAEVFRAGVQSIPGGQRHAALALGMTRLQAARRIVLPQAITRMLPAIGNQAINLVKESALVSVINLQELMWYAQSLAGFTMRSVEILSAVALIYAALTLPQAFLVNYLHRRYAVS
jgi:His/Glu/Gln/Arg/opine family amino acid ABC transporter permease subunit